MSQFSLNKNYSFNTLAAPILNSSYKNVKMVGIIDYKLASSFMNIPSSHAKIYPYLPQTTPNSPENYEYMLFEVNGDRIVLALEWIDTTSIEEVSGQSIQIVIQSVTNQDIIKIKNILTTAGYIPTIKYI